MQESDSEKTNTSSLKRKFFIQDSQLDQKETKIINKPANLLNNSLSDNCMLDEFAFEDFQFGEDAIVEEISHTKITEPVITDFSINHSQIGIFQKPPEPFRFKPINNTSTSVSDKDLMIQNTTLRSDPNNISQPASDKETIVQNACWRFKPNTISRAEIILASPHSTQASGTTTIMNNDSFKKPLPIFSGILRDKTRLSNRLETIPMQSPSDRRFAGPAGNLPPLVSHFTLIK